MEILTLPLELLDKIVGYLPLRNFIVFTDKTSKYLAQLDFIDMDDKLKFARKISRATSEPKKQSILEHAASKGYLDVVCWILPQLKHNYFMNQSVILAAKNNKFEIVNFLADSVKWKKTDWKKCLNYAVQYSNKNFINYAYQTCPANVLFILKSYTKFGRSSEIKYWYRLAKGCTQQLPEEVGILKSAAKSQRQDIIDFFLQEKEANYDHGLYGATSVRNYQLIDYFISLGARDWFRATKVAMKKGYLELVSFFHDKGNVNMNYITHLTTPNRLINRAVMPLASFRKRQSVSDRDYRVSMLAIGQLNWTWLLDYLPVIHYNYLLIGGARGGHWSVVERALQGGADISQLSLETAVRGANMRIIRLISPTDNIKNIERIFIRALDTEVNEVIDYILSLLLAAKKVNWGSLFWNIIYPHWIDWCYNQCLTHNIYILRYFVPNKKNMRWYYPYWEKLVPTASAKMKNGILLSAIYENNSYIINLILNNINHQSIAYLHCISMAVLTVNRSLLKYFIRLAKDKGISDNDIAVKVLTSGYSVKHIFLLKRYFRQCHSSTISLVIDQVTNYKGRIRLIKLDGKKIKQLVMLNHEKRQQQFLLRLYTEEFK